MSKPIAGESSDLIVFVMTGIGIALGFVLATHSAAKGHYWIAFLYAFGVVVIAGVSVATAKTLGRKAEFRDILVECGRSEAVSLARHEAEIAARQSIREDVLKAIDGDVSEPPA